MRQVKASDLASSDVATHTCWKVVTMSTFERLRSGALIGVAVGFSFLAALSVGGGRI